MGSGVWPLAMATRPAKPAPAKAGGVSCGEGGSVWVRPPRAPCLRRDKFREGRLGVLPLCAGGIRRNRVPPGIKLVRAISTGQLRGLPRFHLRPIDVVVFHGSWARPGFEEGFPLRCVQRLSRPHLATRRCGWRHNRYTRGASLPVLSYWGERLASLEHPRQIGTELSHDVLNPAHVPL